MAGTLNCIEPPDSLNVKLIGVSTSGDMQVTDLTDPGNCLRKVAANGAILFLLSKLMKWAIVSCVLERVNNSITVVSGASVESDIPSGIASTMDLCSSA